MDSRRELSERELTQFWDELDADIRERVAMQREIELELRRLRSRRHLVPA